MPETIWDQTPLSTALIRYRKRSTAKHRWANTVPPAKLRQSREVDNRPLGHVFQVGIVPVAFSVQRHVAAWGAAL